MENLQQQKQTTQKQYHNQQQYQYETEYQEEILKLKKEKEQLKKIYEQRLKEYAVQFALKNAGGKNTKALFALVDLESVILQEDGSVEGLDIKKLKKEVPYLFEDENKKIQGTGYHSTNKRNEQKSETARQFQQALMRR